MADNKLSLIVSFIGQDKLSGALRGLIGLGKTGDQALKGLNREAGKIAGELRQTERAINDAMRSGASGLDTMITRQRELAGAMARVNAQRERQRTLNRIDAQAARITQRGASLQSAGLQGMASGAGLATPLVMAGASAMDFSSGMVDIQQKADLSNAATERMAGTILALARATHQMPEAMRSGVDVLAGMGLDPAQAVKMIGPIGRLATAFKVDIADGANAAFANMNNLKIALGDTGRALDIMAAGGKAGAFEVRDMAQYFPEITASARALGQQGVGAVADLTAALEIARRGTGDSATAANNLQNLLAKINSKGTIDAFKKNFGVDLPAALKRAYTDGKTPLEAIADITKKATGGDLRKLSFAFEDMQAQGALRQLILDMQDYRKIRGQISQQSAGTIDTAFKQREANDPSVAWNGLKGSLSELAITMGTKLMPVLSPFMTQLTGIMGAVGNWAQKNPGLASGLGQVLAVALASKVAFGGLQLVFGTFLGPVAKLWSAWQKYKELGGITAMFPRVAQGFGLIRGAVAGSLPILRTIGSGVVLGFKALLGDLGNIGLALKNAAIPRIIQAFGLLRGGAMFLARGVVRAGLIMLGNPMILAIVAIGVAIGVVAYLVYRNWGTVSATFKAGWQRVQDTLAGAPAWLSSLGSSMMQGLLAMIDPFGLRDRLLAVARNGINFFKSFFGIKSPSRLMMAMGGHMAGGLALGIDHGRNAPLRAMGRMAGAVAGAGALSLAGPAFASAGTGARAGTGAGPGAPITIHIHQQPGEDAQALADKVLRLIEQRHGRARRSSLQDDF